MKHIRNLTLGVAIAAAGLIPLSSANAWVAAAGGYRGGAVAVGGFHPAYRPAGCYGCGAAVGAVAGMAVGAAVASAARPATVVVAQPMPVVVEPPPYAVVGNVPLGSQVAALPSGTQSMVVNGVTFYQHGPTWYKPYFGSSGVYYQVVPAP
ncbi:hypothetical protein QTI66_16210 [Variovorax sp. J22R133]|uniref:DUF6515 family protein n=1 Tax=Variovorax brevis TaxID=3053503 RepID=UPI002578C08B|nr:DUF6515 family protein [Variovorax sp. J22R133]MDM0113704.1 hypothetical protein [Variovorax sp. J22R133]